MDDQQYEVAGYIKYGLKINDWRLQQSLCLLLIFNETQ